MTLNNSVPIFSGRRGDCDVEEFLDQQRGAVGAVDPGSQGGRRRPRARAEGAGAGRGSGGGDRCRRRRSPRYGPRADGGRSRPYDPCASADPGGPGDCASRRAGDLVSYAADHPGRILAGSGMLSGPWCAQRTIGPARGSRFGGRESGARKPRRRGRNQTARRALGGGPAAAEKRSGSDRRGPGGRGQADLGQADSWREAEAPCGYAGEAARGGAPQGPLGKARRGSPPGLQETLGRIRSTGSGRRTSAGAEASRAAAARRGLPWPDAMADFRPGRDRAVRCLAPKAPARQHEHHHQQAG